MEIVCCDCKKFIGHKYPYNDTRQTHGYCQQCYAEAKRGINNEARKRMAETNLPDLKQAVPGQ